MCNTTGIFSPLLMFIAVFFLSVVIFVSSGYVIFSVCMYMWKIYRSVKTRILWRNIFWKCCTIWSRVCSWRNEIIPASIQCKKIKITFGLASLAKGLANSYRYGVRRSIRNMHAISTGREYERDTLAHIVTQWRQRGISSLKSSRLYFEY